MTTENCVDPEIVTNGLSVRLETVFGSRENQEVADELREKAGFDTSAETIRKARKGLTVRIDAALVAAVCRAYDVDPHWLLLGDKRVPAPGAKAEGGRRGLEAGALVPVLGNTDRAMLAALVDVLGAVGDQLRGIARGPNVKPGTTQERPPGVRWVSDEESDAALPPPDEQDPGAGGSQAAG